MSQQHRNEIDAALGRLKALISTGITGEIEKDAVAERDPITEAAIRFVAPILDDVFMIIGRALKDLNRIADASGQNDPEPSRPHPVAVHAVGDAEEASEGDAT